MSVSVAGAASAGYYMSGGGVDSQKQHSYYLGAVQHGETPGAWRGRLAPQLGLEGEVKGRDMTPLYETYRTADGVKLGNAPGKYRTVDERLAAALEAHPNALPEEVASLRRGIEAETRAALLGEDLTFGLPKSVTVAFVAAWRAENDALARGMEAEAEAYRGIRQGIETAVMRANDALIAYASDTMVARVQAEGVNYWTSAPDLVVASFLQHTTRANRGDDRRTIDPHVHVHNVILNKALCDDGQYRALDTEALKQRRPSISAVADRVLAHEMALLGLPMALRPDGKAREVIGIPEAVMELFSERRRNITAKLAPMVSDAEQKLGRSLTDHEVSRLRQHITVFTRASKDGTESDWDRLLDQWQDRLQDEMGRGLLPIAAQLRVAVEQARTRGLEAERTFAPEAVKAIATVAVQEAARKAGTFTRDELILEIDLALPSMPHLTAEQSTALLERLADEAIAEHSVQVTGNDGLPAVDTPGLGLSRPWAERYASPETIRGEQAIREAAVTRGRYSLDRDAVDAWVSERYKTIGADQRAAILGLASSDAALSVLIGPAGAGKSFATGTLAQAWGALSDGGRVVGLTVGQEAAEILQDDGVEATANVSAFLAAQERIAAGRALPHDAELIIGARDIIVVDEASTVGSAAMDRLRQFADEAGARLVATGDSAQLDAVEAGGILDLLQGNAETYTLTEIRRFREEWEGAASLELRKGTPEGIAEYDRRGRILGHEDLPAALDAAARAAAADILDGKETLVVAGTNDEAAVVAAAIRDLLLETGRVDSGETTTLGRDGNQASGGDQVMTRHNDYSLDVRNRGRFTVATAREDGGLEVVDTDGVVHALPPEYVGRHVQLGYASTVHAAQGQTVDRAHFVTDGRTDARALYVAMTRGRERNTAHVSTRGQDRGLEATAGKGELRVDETEQSASAAAVLLRAVQREREQSSAVVTAEEFEAKSRSMGHLLGRLEAITNLAVRERLERQLDALHVEGVLTVDQRAALCAEGARLDHLARVVRAAEQAGHDPDQALRDAIGERSLAGSTSLSKVIAHRLDARLDLRTAAPGQSLPAGISDSHRQYLEAVQDRIGDRVRTLGTEVAEHAPEWAVRTLGPVPTDALERLEWETKAGQVAAYREGAEWSDPVRAIGSAPGVTSTEQRGTWWTAWEALGQPEATRQEAGMTEGRLRAHVAAWEREQTWAPPHADDSLRASEQEAEKGRQEAILARSRGDDEEADRLEAEASRQATIARGMARVAEGRAVWAESTAETRATAERATEELQSRGIDPSAERDRVDPAEWLRAEEDARREDDAHRAITEADLYRADELEDKAAAELHPAAAEDARPGPSRARETASLDPTTAQLEEYASTAEAAVERGLDRASEEATYETTHEAAPVAEAEAMAVERELTA